MNIQIRKVQLTRQYLQSKKKIIIILFFFLNTVFLLISVNPPRNIDLQLPTGGSLSRRGSCGSDTESRVPSGNHTL